MGSWAKKAFGKEQIADVGMVLAGGIKPSEEELVTSIFPKCIGTKVSGYHIFLLEDDVPLITNLRGAPNLIDALTDLHDGGCKNVIFIGFAYGGITKDLEVGSVALPTKAYHFEGIYTGFSEPDKTAQQIMKDILTKNNMLFVEGNAISVPCVTKQLYHDNEEYKKINPLTIEMELAAFFARCKEIGVRGSAVLVISDNQSNHIKDADVRKLRYEKKKEIVKLIYDNIDEFRLEELPEFKEFNVHDFLGRVIHHPQKDENIYRKEK